MARARNNNLKKPNLVVEYTHEQVLELKKCARDPIHFIKTYVKIQHPVKGAIDFVLYDYQEKMIIAFLEHRFTCTLSSRQTGKSTTAAAYLLWYAIFNFDKTVLIAANKNTNAMEMISRIRYAYENLPMWLKPGIKEDGWNKHEVGFDNDSRIISTATSADSGRGMSISCVATDSIVTVRHKTTYQISKKTIEELIPDIKNERKLIQNKDNETTIIQNNDYVVLTPSGFSNFTGILLSEKVLYTVTFNTGLVLNCTMDHLLTTVDENDIELSNITPECRILTQFGPATILEIVENGVDIVADLINVGTTHRYYTNGIVSHNCLFLDEFAFVKPAIQDEFWTSISPTLSTGGTCIMTSTPNGDQNIYAQTWRAACSGTNGFHPIHVKWDEPPGRDEQFKASEIALIGQRKWDQEYDCVFLSSDSLLIDSIFLANISAEIDNIKPKTVVNDVIFYADIKPAETYIIGVDPATGNGKDFSVITIYNFPDLHQVAEYRSNSMSTTDLHSMLKNILKHIESRGATVYYSIENNGVGQGMIALHQADETPVLTAEFISEEGKDRHGINTTAKSKMRCCVNLKELLEKDKMRIQSRTLLSELKSYTRTKGAYAAQPGSTDDCIAATLVVLRIVEEISSYEQAAFDKLYSGKVDDWDDSDWNDYDDGEEILPIVF